MAVVATQLPPEGSVAPDDPLTRHIVPQVFGGLAAPGRPLDPPGSGNRGANGPVRGRGAGRGRGTLVLPPLLLLSNSWGERAVRREPVPVQHHHTAPSRHPQAVDHLGHYAKDLSRPLPVAPQLRADPPLSHGAVHPHPVPGYERSSPTASVVAPLMPHPRGSLILAGVLMVHGPPAGDPSAGGSNPSPHPRQSQVRAGTRTPSPPVSGAPART